MLGIMHIKEVNNNLTSKDNEEFFRLVNAMQDVDETDDEGWSIIFHCIRSDFLDGVNYLISRGADINIQDNDGYSPLSYAASGQKYECTQVLCEAGAKINLQDKWGNTALSRAVYNSRDNDRVSILLLRYGANPDIKNYYGVSARDTARMIANYDMTSILEAMNHVSDSTLSPTIPSPG